jgi:hypothetical protein
MKVVDISDEIHKELDSPTDLNVPVISFWIRSNIGALNNHLHTTYALNETSIEIEQVSPTDSTKVVEIGIEEAAVLKKMYMVHYYDSKIKYNIGAASLDTVIEVSDGGSSVRKINKNEVIKSLANLKRQENEELNRLITGFKMSKSEPKQIIGDDVVEGDYGSDGDYSRTAKEY